MPFLNFRPIINYKQDY